MMWKTTKDAVGWYANFRRGPKQPKHSYKPQVRTTAKADSETWIAMAGVLHEVSVRKGVSLELLMRWATTADEGFSVDGKLSGALGELRKALEAKGFVEPRARPVACTDHWFEDLNTGERIRTKRASDD